MQFKQQTLLEEKRKKALDLHLNFIVDQTEKYSSWLTEGLAAGSTGGSSIAGSVGGTSDRSGEGDGMLQFTIVLGQIPFGNIMGRGHFQICPFCNNRELLLLVPGFRIKGPTLNQQVI